MLSYAYHFATEQLYKIRKRRTGKAARVRLVGFVLFYMDDILFIGAAFKDVKKAARLFCAYLRDELGLEIKPIWHVWVARNVEKIEDVADNGHDPADAVPCVYYTADVAYMRAAVTLEEITADTDAAYKRAAAWAPETITQPTTLERIEALEALGNDILAAMFGGE